MTSTVLIGIATALVICAIIAKVAVAPEKASKAERADIMKQLLALSEGEAKVPGKASSVGSRPLPKQATRPATGPRKTPAKISQPIAANK
jgi:hypothetical protein